ncbi:MAG: HDIG domain-containing protein [candidate division Zixibacteria bacterium]|nr:HDIG domain-containing protein [candidate division Zixibacteria bacterium]
MMGSPMNEQPWLTDLLARGEVYEVGGSVRDRLWGCAVQAKDRDYLVRNIPIDDLQQILRQHGDVNLVGKSFGVLKFTPRVNEGEDRATLDIALPRSEQSTGIRHVDFAVDFDPDLPVERDLMRRDFTINALAQDCRTGDIVDPSNGLDDIKSSTLRMVFPNTFREDPLRVLRGAQFMARFKLSLDPETREAMGESIALIESVSMERIAEELTKLLELADKPSIGLRLLHELGALKIVLPELEDTVGVEQPGGFHAYNVFDHTMLTLDTAKKSLRVRWAALLHDINKPQTKEVEGDRARFYGHDRLGARTAKRVLRRLRYPNDLADQVSTLVERHMFTTEGLTDKGVRRLIRRVGPELVYDLLALRRADTIAQGTGQSNDDVDDLEVRITDEINRKSPFGLKDLAVDGRDLMAEFDLRPGPHIGQILHALLEDVLDDPSQNDRDNLLRLARNQLSDNG